MTDKPKTPFIATTKTEGVVVGGLALAVTLLVGFFIGEDRGWIAGLSAGTLAILIIACWPVRKQRWFWGAVATFLALHVFAIVRFDWSGTHSWSGHQLGGLMFVDFLIMMSIVYGLYRLIYGAPTEIVADLPDEPRYGARDDL